MPAPAISLERLSKTYGTTHAVRDVSLDVAAGEIFAFLGPNGAGKSTTIRMILGLQHPTSGSARVFGLDVQDNMAAVHRHIGYLPGELALYPRMTGHRLFEFFAHAHGKIDRTYLDSLVARLDVITTRPVRELSKGNRQKLGIVLAFMHQPELLILDEPTSGLDPLMQHEFELLLRETVGEGRTVFLSSHELDEVQRLADKVAIIKEGQIIVNDTVRALSGGLPRTVEARFGTHLDSSLFARLKGVRIRENTDGHLSLEVSGAIAPVLRILADHNPIDLTCRQASLDELFLTMYSKPANPEPTGHEH